MGFAVVWKMDKIVDTGPEKGHRLHILPTFPTRPGDDAQPNYSHTDTHARARLHPYQFDFCVDIDLRPAPEFSRTAKGGKATANNGKGWLVEIMVENVVLSPPPQQSDLQ